ncbi:MAG: sulfotransferase [Bacteriovorax sp.]|nr:sulfotransferase [Bacteriovorax sp.]
MKLNILDNFKQQLPVATPELIDDVIVVLGSSRSGSSLLYHLLSQHSDINSLPGEDIAYFRLHEYRGINAIDQDDRLLDKDINYSALASTICGNAGKADLTKEPTVAEKINRFILQWPTFSCDINLLQSVFETTSSYEAGLKKLGVNLHLYENFLLNRTLDFDEDRFFIEEPPFIFPKSRSFVKKSRNILILKSSSNAYRMDHIKKLFPKAKYHYFLINRRPEGTVNGLMDGWNSSGFHSHFVGHVANLNIKLYPSKNWWKFDLPPGWSHWTNSSLTEVCAFQWASAYSAILNFLELEKVEFGKIDYEDFFTPHIALKKINQFLNSINLASLPMDILMPETMTTKKPSLDRWKEKKDLITPIVEQDNIKNIHQRLQEIK